MLVRESVCWSDPSHVRQETRKSRVDDVSDGDDGKMVDGHITFPQTRPPTWGSFTYVCMEAPSRSRMLSECCQRKT